MYLTRMELSTERRATLKALASPSRIHGIVESAFSGERKRNLWRIDSLNGKVYLMILSEDEPDLSNAAAQYAPLRDQTWQTKSIESLLDRVTDGSTWRFRLTANPTRSINIPGERGKVKACVTVDDQKQWLVRKSEDNGFAVEYYGFDVVHSHWYKFQKGNDRNRTVTLRGITYEGILTVTDKEKFKEALTRGIGRGKAYGMGLMTIIRP